MYDDIMDDDSISWEDYTPSVSADHIWFIFFEDGEISGLCRFDLVTHHMYNCHIVILPKHRGKGSTEWPKMAIQFMRDQHEATCFITMSDLPPAIKYAKKVGFKYVHTFKNSIKRKGIMHDQVLSEISS